VIQGQLEGIEAKQVIEEGLKVTEEELKDIEVSNIWMGLLHLMEPEVKTTECIVYIKMLQLVASQVKNKRFMSLRF
jgi:hypothetical protein